MPIEKVELLEDRIRVKYHLQKPYGVPDVDDELEILYKDIENLPQAPEEVGLGKTRPENGERIYIPECRKTILFIFDKYQERDGGPAEESIYGPYRPK